MDSVLSQGYPNLEYIVIDGGSTDESRQTLKAYSPRLDYWVSEKDAGQSQAINKGLAKATGEIVAWINSDDLYTENCMSLVGNLFGSNPEVDIVYGHVENFPHSGGESQVMSSEFDPVELLNRNTIHQPGVFFRKSLLESVGLLDESLHYCMDYDLWLRLFLQFRSLRSNKILARFRLHPGAKTSGNPRQMYKEWRRVLCKLLLSLNPDSKKRLQALRIFYESDAPVLPIQPTFKLDPQIAVRNYIYQCALQEYTFGNVSRANRLLYESFGSDSWYRSAAYMLSNSLGLKKLNIV